LTASLFMHLVRVPAWRARARAMREFEADKADAAQDAEGEGEYGDEADAEPSEATEEDMDGDDEIDIDEDDSDLDEDVEELDDDTEDADEEANDEIDIGSHIGLVFDDEEVFGTIVEFDDEEGTVTIEEDGSGDLVTGYQDDMFLE
jgi:hypothetical protein